MEGTDNRIKIKIKLTLDDVGSKRFYINLGKADVEEHLLKHWSPTIIKRATIDDIRVPMEDLDTHSEHEVNFRYYKHFDSYFIQGHWRKNFIDRRLLMAGDEIGIGCSNNPADSSKLCFCVLKRASGMGTSYKN